MKKSKHSLPNKKKQELIKLIVSHLEKNHPELSAAYIFGSFATGSEFSDIDLALLFRSYADEPLQFELSTENKIEQILHLSVDVRVMNKAPLSFQYQIIRDGKVILDRGPNFRAEYQGQVIKQYCDFARFRKRYLKEVGHATV